MKHFSMPKLYLILLCSIASYPIYAADKPAATPAISKVSNSNEVVLTPNSPQLTSLRIETVTDMIAPAAEPLNGKISFDENHTARINSPVVGRATSIKAQIGDSVKAGQVLMVMDSPDLGSAVADARKAEADLQLKRQALERNRMLLQGGVIARKELENSQADLSESQAEAERANARLKNLGASRGNNESYAVRSPITGIVVDRKVNPSSEVRPDATDPLFIITNPNFLWANIDLPERDLSKVAVGQAVSVQVDAYPNEVFSGTVKSIGVMLDPTTRRVPVRCSIDSKGKLKPEMYARITPLSQQNNKVIRLPNSALITEGLYSYVFVEETPNHLKKRRVTLDLQEREYATVKEGLKAGERVVTVGAILLNSELSAGQ